MQKKCLKCGFDNADASADEMAACPSCGAIYSKVEAIRQAEEQKAAAIQMAEQEKAAARAREQAFVDQAKAKHAEERQNQTPIKGQGAVLGGWLCVILGLALMAWSGLLIVLYGPLFLAAFVLGIVALAQGRPGHGVVVLLLAIVIPTTLGLIKVGQTAKEISDAQESVQAERSTRAEANRVKSIAFECEKRSSYMSASVSVQNRGPELRFAKAFIEFKDKSGKVVAIENPYFSDMPTGSMGKASTTTSAPGAESCTLASIQDRHGHQVRIEK